MPVPIGSPYAINGISVSAPDEELWPIVAPGAKLSGLQSRSGYRLLEWHKLVADRCQMDWYDYDDTVLSSITCRKYNSVHEYETYTDAICQSVTSRKRRGVESEIVATFLIYVGA